MTEPSEQSQNPQENSSDAAAPDSLFQQYPQAERQYLAAIQIIRQLQAAGKVAYLAGGCVRDALLGRTPKDFDVATDAKPSLVRKIFPRSQRVGESFGVILVHMKHASIEVATFRKEWGYADGRHPDHVQFTHAREDARRRDFTINALFADPLADAKTPAEKKTQESAPPGPWLPGFGQIIDYVNGVKDLHAQRVRAVGNADERFAEDYLRMLRAVRFAARLGFNIEDKTARAIALQAKYLGQISRERIGQEVQWMLTETVEARLQAVTLMQQLKLDAPVLNESPANAELVTMSKLPSQAAYTTVLAAWMLDRHVTAQAAYTPPGADAFATLDPYIRFVHHSAGEVIPRWRRALCMSNQHRDLLRDTLGLLPQAAQWPQLAIARRKRLLAHHAWPHILDLLHALDSGGAAERIVREAEPLVQEGFAPEPLLTGQDLIALGLKPSPQFGDWLEQAYDEQLENRIRTRNDALNWLRQQFHNPST